MSSLVVASVLALAALVMASTFVSSATRRQAVPVRVRARRERR